MLDASAVIAWLKNETGAEKVEAALQSGSAVISSMNLAEVLARFRDLGSVARNLEIEGLVTRAFSAGDAVTSGDLRADTRALGLSLGDRACLALARQLGAPALTADRAWATLSMGVRVELPR